MLLANVTVATKLYTAIPKTALLRIHKDPSKYSLNTVCDTLRKYGIHLDGETTKSLQTSIRHYDPEYNAISVNNSMKYIMTVIINLCSKTMMVKIFTLIFFIFYLYIINIIFLYNLLYSYIIKEIGRIYNNFKTLKIVACRIHMFIHHFFIARLETLCIKYASLHTLYLSYS